VAINDCNGDDALSSDCEQISLIEQPKRAIRVLLADDDTLVLAALADLLSDDPRIEIIGTVGNAGAAVEMARAERPDVAVFDLMMPGGGVQATLELGRLCPRTQVIGY
jgi:two-component system response regulator DesR